MLRFEIKPDKIFQAIVTGALELALDNLKRDQNILLISIFICFSHDKDFLDDLINYLKHIGFKKDRVTG